jgi:flavin-dependent dehydrogenase
MREFDAVVLGGGPAGSTAALRLAQVGRRVCLVEPHRSHPPPFGQTAAPEIRPVLHALGVWERFRSDGHLPSPGTVSYWGSARRESDFISNPHGCAWHLDRARFDAMLRQAAAEAGVTVMRGPHRPEAAMVVDATGVRGKKRDDEDRMLAIVLRLSRNSNPDLRTWIESTPSGWWYSAPMPHGDIAVMFFTSRKVYLEDGIALRPLLDLSPLTRGRFEGSRLVDSRVMEVRSGLRNPIAGTGWVAAGDSAASYDPLSGRGIWNALWSGMAAADAVHAALGGDASRLDRYVEQVRADFEKYSALRREYYAVARWNRPFGLP